MELKEERKQIIGQLAFSMPAKSSNRVVKNNNAFLHACNKYPLYGHRQNNALWCQLIADLVKKQYSVSGFPVESKSHRTKKTNKVYNPNLHGRSEAMSWGDPGELTPENDSEAPVNSSNRLSLSWIFSLPNSSTDTRLLLDERTYISSTTPQVTSQNKI